MSDEILQEKLVVTCVPPKKFERNEFGLLCNNEVNYVYDANSLIDWRAMIDRKYLVPNKQIFEKNGKSVPTSIDGLQDRELLILLAGIKNLAQIRGYSKVEYEVSAPSHEYVTTICKITWIPNYESEGREIVFSSIGDASLLNTTSFGKFYLAAISENRAFVRAVRNFLRINIVGADEIGAPIPDGASNPNTKPSTLALKEVMDKYKVSFDVIKKNLIKEDYLTDKGINAANLETIDQIDSAKQFELIGRIKKKSKKVEIETTT